MEKLGIYGGSFSPIHIGHMAAAYTFKNELGLDRLLIIPASLPPHKTLSDNVPASDRFEMCRLAFDGVGGIEVSDIELRRKGKSYSYDTVVSLTDPGRKLYMLCGTDMILTFKEWYRFEDILKSTSLVYIRREDSFEITEKLENVCRELTARYGAEIIPLVVNNKAASMCGIFVNGDDTDETDIHIGISSTMIREKIKHGEEISGLVCPKVEEFIRCRGLYLK